MPSNTAIGRCEYCGRAIHYDLLEIDHVVPASGGLVDDLCVYACASCNRSKGTRALGDWVPADPSGRVAEWCAAAGVDISGESTLKKCGSCTSLLTSTIRHRSPCPECGGGDPMEYARMAGRTARARVIRRAVGGSGTKRVRALLTPVIRLFRAMARMGSIRDADPVRAAVGTTPACAVTRQDALVILRETRADRTRAWAVLRRAKARLVSEDRCDGIALRKAIADVEEAVDRYNAAVDAYNFATRYQRRYASPARREKARVTKQAFLVKAGGCTCFLDPSSCGLHKQSWVDGEPLFTRPWLVKRLSKGRKDVACAVCGVRWSASSSITSGCEHWFSQRLSVGSAGRLRPEHARLGVAVVRSLMYLVLGPVYRFRCSECGEIGHYKSSCPELGRQRVEAKVKGTTKCSRCGATGHNVRTCTAADDGPQFVYGPVARRQVPYKVKGTTKCSRCGATGHNVRTCTAEAVLQDGYY